MFDVSSSKPTLLVIDDIPENLTLMYQLLKEDYKVKGANSGLRGISIAETASPDLILLDIMMPEMDGFEVCERLKSNPATAHIPVIFLTAKSEKFDECRGLQLGAVDYITKPINPDIVKARVNAHVSLKLAKDLLHGEKQALEKEVERRTLELVRQREELHAIQDVAFYAMVSLAETRDNETGNHIRRTQTYIKLLAENLRKNPRYALQLDDRTIDLLYKSAPLHDIGKIGISDTILLKEGKLTEEEFEIMKTHTTIGYEAIQKAEVVTGKSIEFLRYAKEIAYSHHEHWDGRGYPRGLSGTDIPLAARLMAIADVYDALISKRVYKPAFTHQDAVQLILDGKGTHFDPDIVDVFVDIADELYEVALRYAN
ncbi:two-component system response regulator [Vibrio fluvialis]|uniref:response regulator n=1 Tax=Vibrio fluvialis TaxID=676 RepID=UPI000509F645|nr:two-component system response regulator [Vibrio fluvialis]EKO3487649.1 two-component system response regulator [Vibrio fluvialis]EKO3536446.1 two-component system response regulator [Vibrio fluvialis]EKO3931209.1 two-component system response regulator [Vibrio fluvialis]EKO3958929.1 two-component system response regulator [Vibrio fluvialis]MBL4238807.1 two-component system response regulator [Vibrio fluvialis]